MVVSELTAHDPLRVSKNPPFLECADVDVLDDIPDLCDESRQFWSLETCSGLLLYNGNNLDNALTSHVFGFLRSNGVQKVQ